MKKKLPSRPNLEQLKNQAKSFLKGRIAKRFLRFLRVSVEHHPRWQNSSDAILASARFTLADAQLVIANEYGFETWPALKAHLLSRQTSPSMEATIRSLQDAAAAAISRDSTPCSPPILD